MQKEFSASGNRTLIIRVTGGYTDRYTNADFDEVKSDLQVYKVMYTSYKSLAALYIFFNESTRDCQDTIRSS